MSDDLDGLAEIGEERGFGTSGIDRPRSSARAAREAYVTLRAQSVSDQERRVARRGRDLVRSGWRCYLRHRLSHRAESASEHESHCERLEIPCPLSSLLSKSEVHFSILRFLIQSGDLSRGLETRRTLLAASPQSHPGSNTSCEQRPSFAEQLLRDLIGLTRLHGIPSEFAFSG